MTENSVCHVNFLEEVLGKQTRMFFQPHSRNPEIMKLQSKDYQENYCELYSDKSDKPLGVYQNDRDGIISKQEYEALPKEPQRLKDLIKERHQCLREEFDVGIIHQGMQCAVQKIKVPHLVFREIKK